MADDQPIKFTKSGAPDGRGHAEGSKATRFGAGDGRARPGRKKHSRDLKSIVTRVREMPVEAKVNGKIKPIGNTQEGILHAQRSKALAGDTKAAQFLQDKFDRFDVPHVDPELIAKLLEEDRDILAAARRRGVIKPDDEGDSDE